MTNREFLEKLSNRKFARFITHINYWCTSRKCVNCDFYLKNKGCAAYEEKICEEWLQTERTMKHLMKIK